MNPYQSDNLSAFAQDTQPQDPRRAKLAQYSQATLQNLSKFANEPDQETSDLQQQPLYGGNISKSVSVSPTAGEPSAISTERVQRAPAQLSASPLLPEEQRAGNLLTGEEGTNPTYGPLSEPQRNVSLRDFFGPMSQAQFGVNEAAFAPEAPSGTLQNLQQAKQAYGYANTADQATGGNVRSAISDRLRNLYGPSGTPAAAVNAAGVGYGAGGSLVSAADQAAAPLYGAGITPEALPALADTGAAAAGEIGPGAADVAAGSSGSTAGSAAGGALSAYGLVSLIYALGKMGFQYGLGGGEGPSSGNPYMDMAMGLLGPVGDVIGLASKGAFTPSESYRNFGGRLQQTLGNENRSLQNLISEAEQAKTRGDLVQAANLFRSAVGGEGPNPGTGYVGGYSLAPNTPEGAPQINGLPGATGERHEWGRTADFGGPVATTNALLAALYSQLPEGQASPLSQGAFNYGISEPEYGNYGTATQAMIRGESPDMTGYSPRLMDLIQHSVDQYRQNQAQEEMARQASSLVPQL